MDMNIKIKNLNLASLVWLTLGIFVFLLGWCKWYLSIPLVLAAMVIMIKQYGQDSNETMHLSRKNFWIAFVICFLLMGLSGIGGYVVQSADNYWRNAMFRDLVNYSWPVYDSTTGLTKSYYIAFWMVPALLAKLTHSMELGFFMQLLWVSIGFQLLYLQICRYVGKPRLSYLAFFYLFSGLKIIECLLYLPLFGEGSFLSDMVNIVATNGSPGSFHAGPMVQFLYDPFNQTIPLYLGMMLMINEVKGNLLPFIFAVLLLYAPLPLIGLLPLVLYWFVRNIIAVNPQHRLGYVFSLQNIVGLAILLVSVAYLMSNSNSGHKGLRPILNLQADIYAFVIYIIFEFGIFMIIGYKACRDKVALWIAFVSVSLFGWFQLGLHNDFCFRTNMPFIFILCLLVMRRYYMSETSKKMRIFIIAWYVMAGLPSQIHPTLRWLSSCYILAGHSQSELNNYQQFKDVTTLYVMQQTKLRNDDLSSSFLCRPDQYEFRTDVGTPNSFFFKYLAKDIQ
jgi:hypothetical protein